MEEYLVSRGFVADPKTLTNPLNIENRLPDLKEAFTSGRFFYISAIDRDKLRPSSTEKAERWAVELHEKHGIPGVPIVIRFVLTEGLFKGPLKGRVNTITYDLEGKPYEKTVASLAELGRRSEVLISAKDLTPEELGELKLEIATHGQGTPEGEFVYLPWQLPLKIHPEGRRPSMIEGEG